MENYTLYHLHSDLSNAVTNIDSVTKFKDYVSKAKECGMTALAFTEHGSVFEWLHKKEAVEDAGMKYIHGIEAYLTENIEVDGKKVRDNYHCVLLARNYDGVLEINRLSTASFNRDDGHFYYTPRITFSELFSTSDNIIVTSACIGGVFGKGPPGTQDKFLSFLEKNKHRCFLEIGHHKDQKQVVYNKRMVELSERTGIPLIAGTDTHTLNDLHSKCRIVLQRGKNIYFEGEEGWDLTFKTYEELVKAFEMQGAIPREKYMEAIENTNVMAFMVEPFEVDRSIKYPKIYDNPELVFREKINSAIENHPYALKNHSREEIDAVVNDEFAVYKKVGAIDFMLLQTYLRDWEKQHGIFCGPGRGSVSGSMIAYLLGITEMDSIKNKLNFFRFMNPSRVSLADIDSDYANVDRDRVKKFLLEEKLGLPNISTSEIITFNTIALKGSIRDVCRGLYKEENPNGYLKLSEEIIKETEKDERSPREKWQEVFEIVDVVNGVIVSIGSHPSGVLVSDRNIEEIVGLCTTGGSKYSVSMLNMKELDSLNLIKLDVLGLDNVGLINETCKLAGIERLTPDNIDDKDEAVWRSIVDDTTMIFQWESNSAQQYLKKFMSEKTVNIARKHTKDFSYIKWLSFGNGLIRPGCASFRDSVAEGQFYDNGFKELNDFLAPEAGRIAMQETIMKFLVEFCGYSNADSDNVRRAISKKKGTETLLPEIERRFVEYSSEHYNITEERCREVIKPFIQIIMDASAYSFSWNHSDAYSYIGYISGYLRYYYPLEFLTSAMNIFFDDTEKTAKIVKYASKVDIKITMPKWGASKSTYFFNREKKHIAKGLSSIKYISKGTADYLYDLANNGKVYTGFMDVLLSIEKQYVDARQIDTLIKIDFFSEFGNQRELLYITDVFTNIFNRGEAKKVSKSKVDGSLFGEIVKKYSNGKTKSGDEAKFYTILDMKSVLREAENAIKSANLGDLSDLEKVKNFNEAAGYMGYTTGREEDRATLMVLKVAPLKRKKDGKQFGYSIITKSIGSGIESRFTVFNKIYELCPIKENDIIRCKGYEREGRYFKMNAYIKL